MPAVLRARGGAGNTSFALMGTPHIGLAPTAYRPYTTFTPDMIMQKTAAPVASIAAAIASSTAASVADALRPSSRAIICSASCVYCAGACAALPHGQRGLQQPRVFPRLSQQRAAPAGVRVPAVTRRALADRTAALAPEDAQGAEDNRTPVFWCGLSSASSAVSVLRSVSTLPP